MAEQVLPYARFLAKALKIPVELMEVVDLEALRLLANPERGRYVDTLLNERMETNKSYLETVAQSFQGTQVTCFVEKGIPEDVVIQKAAADRNTLIVMATHGRSGIQRWLLGSMADKVLHGSTNHMFLLRASDQGKIAGEAALKTVMYRSMVPRWRRRYCPALLISQERWARSHARLRVAALRYRRGLRVLLS